MNVMIGKRPVQVGQRTVSLVSGSFAWRGRTYIIDTDAVKIEKAKWPKKQRVVLEYDVKKSLPEKFSPHVYEHDSERIGLVFQKGIVKTILKNNDRMLMILALLALVVAGGAMSFVMYLQGHPETFMSEGERTAYFRAIRGDTGPDSVSTNGPPRTQTQEVPSN